MATLKSTTSWKITDGSTSKTFTIPALAAGDKVIVTSGGGAIVTAQITNSSGATFSKRTTYGGGSQDVSIQDYDSAAGGETAVYLSLNGADNVTGHIKIFHGLGAYVAGSATNNGTGTSPGFANSMQCQPTADSVLASGSGVLIGIFSNATAPGNTTNRYLQCGPYGHRDDLNIVADGVANGKAKAFVATTVHDITSAKSYPENLAAGHYRPTVQDYSASNSFAAAAIYADTSGIQTIASAPNAIARENTLPGQYQGDWYIGNNAVNEGTIAGFTDKVSYKPGDTVNFKVDSSGNTFNVTLFRLGHYGIDVNGARNPLGWGASITGTVVTQPAPTADGTTGAVSCNWTTNASWTIPSDACPGVYIAFFRRTDAGNTTKYHLTAFVVRPVAATGTVAVMIPDFTWQAYNSWGATTDHGDRSGVYTGRSFYELGVDSTFAHRGYAVSTDRPLATQSMRANSWINDSEQPFIVFAESQGYNLSYFTNTDLHENTALFKDASALVVLGHQEYWTREVYDGVLAARDNGVNTAFLSSNTALWHTRFDDPGNAALFDDSIGTAYFNMTAGNCGAMGTGAHTIAVLYKTNPNSTFHKNCDIALYSSGSINRELQAASGAIFGQNDFSSGVPASLVDNNAWYILAISKPAGSAPYRGHWVEYAPNGTGTMFHGVASNAANHGDGAAIDAIRIGNGSTNSNGAIALVGLWDRVLSDAELESLMSSRGTVWKNLNPKSLISLRTGTPVDVVGTSTLQTTVGTITTDTKPTGFDYVGAPHRLMTCYKDSATVDVALSGNTVGPGFTGTGRDPINYTGTWRDARTSVAPNNPDVRRDNAMTGQFFNFNTGIGQAVHVQFSKKGLPIWRNNAGVQALTSGGEWTTPLGIGMAPLGDEGDYPNGDANQPAHMALLSATTFSGTIGSNDQGTLYSQSFSNLTMSFTLYKAASGAYVFATGAWRGHWGTSRYWGSFNSTVSDVNWQNSWLAILYDLGIHPTTLQSPQDYLQTQPTDPAIGAPTDVAAAYGLNAPTGGVVNEWTGSAWVAATQKVWSGSAWVSVAPKRFVTGAWQ